MRCGMLWTTFLLPLAEPEPLGPSSGRFFLAIVFARSRAFEVRCGRYLRRRRRERTFAEQHGRITIKHCRDCCLKSVLDDGDDCNNDHNLN